MSKMQNAIPETDRPKMDPSQVAAPAWAEQLIIDEATGAVLKPGIAEAANTPTWTAMPLNAPATNAITCSSASRKKHKE